MSVQTERARLLIGQHRFEMAEKELGLALAQQPNDPMAHALMAFCLAARNRFEVAEQHARQAVALAPDVGFTYFCLARVLETRNDLAAAEAAAKEALRLEPNDEDYYVLLGEICLHQRRWKAALQAAERALSMDPEHVNAKNLRAEALRQMGRPVSAESELRANLAVDPEEAWTHCNLGWTLLQSGKRDQAMHHFRESLRLEPELESARLGVVETLKANNFFYRGMLQYFLWMSRLTRRGQWAVILGLWIGYTVLRRVAAAMPTLKPWIMPLLIAYLGFVVVSWLAQPLANLALRLHPFGRLALSRDERTGSNWLGLCLLAGILCGIGYLLVPSALMGCATLYILLMALPLAATFHAEAPWPRNAMIIYTAFAAVVGVLGILGTALPKPAEGAPLGTLLTVLLAKVSTLLFPLLIVLSLFIGNILVSVRWKR